MKEKEFINQEIKSNYSTEDSQILANRLGITLAYLRVKAKRLKVKKGSRTITNEIINGKKLCPKCCKTLDLEKFNRDKYQPNNLDYWCRNCRKKSIDKKKKTDKNNKNNNNSNQYNNMGFGVKKTRNNIIRIEDTDCLRCKSCNEIKALSNFHKDKNNITKHKNFCKSCVAAKRKKVKKVMKNPWLF